VSAPEKCGTVSCEAQPAVRVFWPGKTLDMCGPCAERARTIAGAMGFALTVDALSFAKPPAVDAS